MKHAYLILAHNQFEILNILLHCLDDERNDIYLHIDRRLADIPEIFTTTKAKTFLLDKRVKVYWGDVSMVQAEYNLFENAFKHGPYQYYHLLSGVDLPIKSQDFIHHFFDENNGKEFIGFRHTSMNDYIVQKMQRYYLFPKSFQKYRGIERYIRYGFVRLQELFHVKRNVGIDFKHGSQWVSITEAFVEYFLAHKKKVLHSLRRTNCPDEFVFQTLVFNSPFATNLYDTTSDSIGCGRCIGWRKDGRIVDWSTEMQNLHDSDFETLAHSPSLFARKFDNSDMHFINKVLTLSNTH